MLTLALDCATARCTVAVTAGEAVVSRAIDGPRRHAREVLGVIDEALGELGARPADITRVLTGDGPGSFTGLRVAGAVAQALVWNRQAMVWEVAPSLLIRAVAHAPPAGGTVLALADALRGELYAGCWRVAATAVIRVGAAPRALTPAALAEFGAVDVVVGSIPEPLVEAVAVATGCRPVTGDIALPDARALLRLGTMAGGTVPVAEPSAWRPHYGRPAEAQAVWERRHGRPLPDSTFRSG
jgi:tRNA threonylcarbamoyl adenosine modification protein YeaZ